MPHLQAVDDWLAEMEREYGPIPPETLDWAAKLVGRWRTGEARKRRAG